jgi:hypothetical protein
LAITTTEGDKFTIRVTRETPKGISGIVVDKDGDEIVPPGVDAKGRAFHTRTMIVPRDAIKKSVEMRMNVVYGRIERAE